MLQQAWDGDPVGTAVPRAMRLWITSGSMSKFGAALATRLKAKAPSPLWDRRPRALPAHCQNKPMMSALESVLMHEAMKDRART